MYPQREVFDDAPLELVAAEIRYPYAPRLRQQAFVDALLEQLAEDLPVMRRQQQVEFIVSPDAASANRSEDVPRLFDRTLTTSATVTPTAVTVETTHYREFANFRTLVLKIVDAVTQYSPIAAIERVGLRYIDEIRVPGPIADIRDWRDWVADALVGVVDLGGEHPATTGQGAIEYRLPGGYMNLVFRFAAMTGRGVVGGEPLKRRHPVEKDEPVFVLDFDCYYQPPLERAPDFSSKRIGDILDSLHTPTGAMFQHVITDRLRELFRG